MRLSKEEIDIIKGTVKKYAGDARIVLFGSRVYDDKKGGDIDLCVETQHKITLREKLEILTELELAGIARRVDLLLKMPHSKEKDIFKSIEKEGVLL